MHFLSLELSTKNRSRTLPDPSCSWKFPLAIWNQRISFGQDMTPSTHSIKSPASWVGTSPASPTRVATQATTYRSLQALQAHIRKKHLKKSLFGGLQKVPEQVKNTPKSPIWGIFELFRVVSGSFLQTKKTPFCFCVKLLASSLPSAPLPKSNYKAQTTGWPRMAQGKQVAGSKGPALRLP